MKHIEYECSNVIWYKIKVARFDVSIQIDHFSMKVPVVDFHNKNLHAKVNIPMKI